MKFFEFAGEGVGVGGGESPSPIGWERVAGRPGEGQSPDGVEYVQSPAALGDGYVFQRFDAPEFFPHFVWRNNDGLLVGRGLRTAPRLARRASPTSWRNCGDDGNAGFGGDPVQGDVASNPAGTAGGG